MSSLTEVEIGTAPKAVVQGAVNDWMSNKTYSDGSQELILKLVETTVPLLAEIRRKSELSDSKRSYRHLKDLNSYLHYLSRDEAEAIKELTGAALELIEPILTAHEKKNAAFPVNIDGGRIDIIKMWITSAPFNKYLFNCCFGFVLVAVGGGLYFSNLIDAPSVLSWLQSLSL